MLRRFQSLALYSAFSLGIGLLLQACVPDFLVSNPDWVVIEAFNHESTLKRKTGVLISPREVSATVTFDSSCIYDLQSVDQNDWNKVIGLGFVGSKNQSLGSAPHQVDGARVGWRWNPETQKIDLACYAYVDGQRTAFKVGETSINQPVYLSIKIDYNKKEYRVMEGEPIRFTHNKKFAYKTGLYFGGNRPAPHAIRVKIVD